jgi:hypothetical protein
MALVNKALLLINVAEYRSYRVTFSDSLQYQISRKYVK